MVERRNDDNVKKGNCCNLWGRKEIYEFLLMRRGTILSELNSGTAVAAKARKRSAFAFTNLFRPSGGQYLCPAIRLPEVRGLIGVLLDLQEANLDLKVQLLYSPV